jgi:hypothetical protein
MNRRPGKEKQSNTVINSKEKKSVLLSTKSRIANKEKQSCLVINNE